jgi:hypothetical protein
MKKITVGLLTTVVLFALSTQANARMETNPAATTSVASVESAKVTALITRLNEIKAMDKSAMTSSEKKDLRKEVRTIKKEVKDGGGVYISVAGLLLVIILLIILL